MSGKSQAPKRKSTPLDKTPQRVSAPTSVLDADFNRQLIESIDDYAVFSLDLAGTITSWNHGAERLVGYRKAEIIGQNSSKIHTREDITIGQLVRELEEAARVGHVDHYGWLVRKDQSFFWSQGKIFALRDDRGSHIGYSIVLRDMTIQMKDTTDQGMAGGVHEPSRSQIMALLLQAPAAIAVLHGPQYRFEMVNARYMELIGLEHDVMGRTVLEAVPEVAGQGFIELLDGVYQSGKPFIGNEIPIELDGVGHTERVKKFLNFVYQPILDHNGEVDGIFVHAVDVTPQVIARKRVEASELRLAMTQDAATIGSYEVDIATGLLQGSSRMGEVLGLSSDDLKKAFVNQEARTHPDDLGALRTKLQAAQKDHTAYTIEYRTKVRDGSWRWIMSKGQFEYDDEAKPVRMVGVIMDVTDRKQLERQKDDFIGIASHELKTPVTSMKAYVQVLGRRFQRRDDFESAETMGKINAQLDKLTALIADLLDVTKVQSGNLQFSLNKFDFDELVSETVEMMQVTTELHQLSITGQLGGMVTGDRERTSQVLINLLSNAIKYSPHTKEITIHVERNEDAVTCCIIDRGIGISDEKKKKVFERFFRVSGPNMESFPGLGLGLYISSEIIKRLGGKIWVESDEGNGSTFCFTVPLDSSSVMKQQTNDKIEDELAHE